MANNKKRTERTAVKKSARKKAGATMMRDTSALETYQALTGRVAPVTSAAEPVAALDPSATTAEAFGPVMSLADLQHRAHGDDRYRDLAIVAAENLGRKVRNLDEAMDWLRTNANETDEESLVAEVNGVRDLVAKSEDKSAAAVPTPPQSEEAVEAAPGAAGRVFKSPFTAKTYDMATADGKAQFARQHGRFVARGWTLYLCEHKHESCSIFDDGPCSNEFGAKAAAR